jgi:uncharacterized repeat protein (TIGR03803 family)
MWAILIATSYAAGQAPPRPEFRTLYSFQGTGDGNNPLENLSISADGVLYGTALYAPNLPNGVVFSLTPPPAEGGAWTETVVHVFLNGSEGNAPASVLSGKDGALYGNTFGGGIFKRPCSSAGCGTVFLLTSPVSSEGPRIETVLHRFTSYPLDGAYPMGPMAMNSNGVLYGVTSGGGAADQGTVFQVTPPATAGGAWIEKTIRNFSGHADGRFPTAGLVIGDGGLLYGITEYGGISSPNCITGGCGTVFSLTPPTAAGEPWAEEVLHSFTGGSDGNQPYLGLTIGAGGVLYGTTYNGGSGSGTVFSLTPPLSPEGAWTDTLLYAFTGGNDGYEPRTPVVIGPGGLLYGLTAAGAPPCVCGTVYSLTPPSSPGGAWTHTVLHSFTGAPAEGSIVLAALAIGKNGVLYGATSEGGTANMGTVFALKP